MRRMRIALAACTLPIAAAYAGDSDSSAPVTDDVQPDGSLTLDGNSVAARIGYIWDRRELEYQNSSRHFSIKSVALVEAGASDCSASGYVYNRRKREDFSGNYVPAGAGVTVAGGGTATYLRNEHGVVIKLTATDVGLQFALSAEGVHVALQK
jgi:hypothetical protein